jgi:WD40 repeat protein
MGNKLFKSNSAYNESPAAATPPIHSGGILDVICNQKDGTIVTASEDKSICMFKSYECMKSYATMKKTYLKGHMKTVNRVCLGGNKVFSASRDLSIRIWDMNNQEISNVIEDCHSLNISAISATKDGSFCASGSRDYSVKVRNVEMGKVIQEYSTPRNVVTFLKYDESDTLLYQGSEDLCMRVYDTRSSSRMPSKELPGYIYFPISIDIHHNGNYLITGYHIPSCSQAFFMLSILICM